MKKELAVIKKDIGPLVKIAEEINIEGEKDVKVATETLSQLNDYKAKAKKEKKSITDPADLIIKTEKARWKPLEELLEEGINNLRDKLGFYQTTMINIAREKEESIANRVGEGKGKLKGETAMRQINEIDVPAEKIETDSGKLSFRATPKLKITNYAMVKKYVETTGDWSFMQIMESSLFIELQAGKKVPGAEIEIIQVPVNRRV